MGEGRGEIELYNQWFQLADLDRDGMLSGAEAVQFFLRSGLPQNPTLFRVWQHVAGDRPTLNRQQFYTAMKLVACAQANGGLLDDQQAMRTVNGLSGPTPPPRMAGLEFPSMSGGPPPLTSGPAPSRAAPAPPPGTIAYLPLAPDKASAYQTAFEQLDGDQDGLVQGIDCFPAFMRSGLPKDALKAIWDMVAGDAGAMNRHQFVQCLYLIDSAKAGIPLPPSLPQGQFPPIQGGGVGINTMVDRSQQQDIYSGKLFVAPIGPKAAYAPGSAPAVAFQSQVPPPPPPAQLSGLAAAESARLQQEREAALRQESERQRAEEARVAVSARREFYTQALADLRVAQSKVARTLVEAQQRLEMERAEAEGMEIQYNAAYEGFSTEHARASPLLEALKRAEDEKAALAAKMAALQTAVAQLEEYDPEWEVKQRAGFDAMKKEITLLMVRHQALRQAKEAVLRQRGTLEEAITCLKDASEHVKTSVASLEAEIIGLSTDAKTNGATLTALLQRLAPLYNELYDAAKAAMIPLPKEALATIARPPASAFKYDPLRFGSAAVDWDLFVDEGFTIAAAIPPDSRLASLTSSALAKAEEEAAASAGGGGEEKEASGDAHADESGQRVDQQVVEPSAADGEEEAAVAAEDEAATAESVAPLEEEKEAEGGSSDPPPAATAAGVVRNGAIAVGAPEGGDGLVESAEALTGADAAAAAAPVESSEAAQPVENGGVAAEDAPGKAVAPNDPLADLFIL